MSTPAALPAAAAAAAAAEPQEAEMHLGRALAAIHRVLPRLDEPDRADDVQAALAAAAAQVEAARAAHERFVARVRPAAPDAEIMAVIAAAVAVVVGRPHRVLDVRKAAPAVTWINAWAIEGRFQHYSSHKVR